MFCTKGRLEQTSGLFRVGLPILIIALARRMSLQFPHLRPGSPSHWFSDSSCRPNVTISGVGFVYQIRARRYDKRPHLPGDVAVVESRCGNNQFGRTRDRSIGRGEQHFSNHPGFLWGSGGHIEITVTAAASSRVLTALTVSPGSQTITTTGQTAQLIAIGTYSAAPLTQDLSNTVTWTSSNVQVANVSSSGLVSGVGVGQTTVTALATASDGSVITANGTIIVGTAPSGRILTSLTVIPPSQTVYAIGETAQYIAIGTFSAAPLTLDLTNQVAWQSSDIQIGQVNSSGLVTGIGAVTLPPGAEPIATITALATASDGSIVAASGAFEELATSVVNLPTLTVYKVGSGTGTVTAGSSLSSDGTSLQGTAVINCGSGAECVGTFPAGSKVYLVAAAIAGSKFDGWSVNCPLVSPSILNVCSITMTSNSTVGAIFDPTTP